MTEIEIRKALEMLLVGEACLEDTALIDTSLVTTFEDACLLTDDEGLVVRMKDGSEFQITIRQSR